MFFWWSMIKAFLFFLLSLIFVPFVWSQDITPGIHAISFAYDLNSSDARHIGPWISLYNVGYTTVAWENGSGGSGTIYLNGYNGDFIASGGSIPSKGYLTFTSKNSTSGSVISVYLNGEIYGTTSYTQDTGGFITGHVSYGAADSTSYVTSPIYLSSTQVRSAYQDIYFKPLDTLFSPLSSLGLKSKVAYGLTGFASILVVFSAFNKVKKSIY